MQLRDRRLSEDIAVGWSTINAHFPRDSPVPLACSPVPAPSHAHSHMTIEEVFETQRLRDKLRKASDEAELTAFMNTNIVPIIRELNERRAQCGALEKQLRCAQTSLAGHVVSARPGVARVIPGPAADVGGLVGRDLNETSSAAVARWSERSQGPQGKGEGAPCCSAAPDRPRPTRKKKTEHERRSNTRRRQGTLFWYCWWSYQTIGEKKSFGIVQIGLEPAGLNRRRVRSRVRS
jgi:hypothetical protein